MNLAADGTPTNRWSTLCYLARLALVAFFLWLTLRD